MILLSLKNVVFTILLINFHILAMESNSEINEGYNISYTQLVTAIHERNKEVLMNVVGKKEHFSQDELYALLLFVLEEALENYIENDFPPIFFKHLMKRDDVIELLTGLPPFTRFQDIMIFLYAKETSMFFDVVIQYGFKNIMEHLLADRQRLDSIMTLSGKRLKTVEDWEVETGQSIFKKAALKDDFNLVCIVFNRYVLDRAIYHQIEPSELLQETFDCILKNKSMVVLNKWMQYRVLRQCLQSSQIEKAHELLKNSK